MGIILCPNCKTRVLPNSDGTCPSCRSLITEAEEQPASQAVTNASSEPVFTLPPIAGFRRRYAAWLVDTIILGIVGQIVGWSFSSFWFRVGPYGRVVGLVVITLYFGLMNSRFGNGQTLGKRLLTIAVRGQDNKTIGVGRSFLRISILAAPAILNQWALPILQTPVLQWLLAIIVFGLGAAILYTMVFNRQTRQGLHDLLCGTYVVNLADKPVAAFPQTARIHWILAGVSAVLAVILAVGGSFVASGLVSRTGFTAMSGLSQKLQTDDRFFSASVNDITSFSSQNRTVHLLQVEVWYRGVPSDEERTQTMNDIAKAALQNITNINQYDLMRISLTSGYDLGIASGHVNVFDGEPISVWRQRIGSAAQ